MSNGAIQLLASGASIIAIAAGTALSIPSSAAAQARGGAATAPAAGEVGEVIVTARKRAESIMKTPVVVQAVTSQQVQDRKIVNIQSLATATPGMIVQEGFGGVGNVLFLRGVGNGSSAIFIDQSVALNVDGATLSQGTFYRVGMFDVERVEVMKGPQSLFFGKSTDAGVISITSADPTPVWDAKLTAGYEVNAREKRFQGFVAGPITDDIGVRLAGYYSNMDGWLKQANPADPRSRMPDEETYGGRLTLAYTNHENLRIKFKATQFHQEQQAWSGDMSQRQCFFDHAQKPNFPFDNCRLDEYNTGSILGLPFQGLPRSAFFAGSPAFATSAVSAVFRDGIPYNKTEGSNFVLNGDYDVAPKLTLTSVTSFTQAENRTAGRTAGAALDLFFDIGNVMKTREFSQELRLTSNYNGLVDFMLGVFYDEGQVYNYQAFAIPSFTLSNETEATMKNRTLSGFGQVLIRPTPKFEIALGARYTDDSKWMSNLTAFGTLNPPFAPPAGPQLAFIPDDLTHVSASAFTPEVTLTYRPTDQITTFASYKKGFKGPGFNVNTTAGYFYAPDAPVSPVDLRNNGINSFGPEKVKGGEGGVKATLLDRRLNLTVIGYYYDYKGQQVSFVNSATNVGTVVNGNNARIKGVEVDATYIVPQVDGLSVNGSVNYNDAIYTSFPIANCYSGQDAALGCSGAPNRLTGVAAQDLTGKRPYKAPRWTATWGGDYSRSMWGDYLMNLTANFNYSSSYFLEPEQNPFTSYQKSYITVDAALRFGPQNRRWEVALVGKNLSNAYYAMEGIDDGSSPAPGIPGDTQVYLVRPRQIELQFTYRPF